MPRPHRRSPLALIVLALLAEEPMHPYRMQQLIKERDKDRVVNVAQHNSVYQTIDRLQRAELIEARETTRDERRPERTTYAITAAGRDTLNDWLRTMLSTPAREFPEFPAALASMVLLPVTEVLHQLEARAETLEQQLRQIDVDLSAADLPPRVFVLETEYLRAVQTAELTWVRGLVEALRSGEISWDVEWLTKMATSFGAQEP